MKRSDLDLDDIPEETVDQLNAFINDVEGRVNDIRDKMDISNYLKIEDFNGIAEIIEKVAEVYYDLKNLTEDLY